MALELDGVSKVVAGRTHIHPTDLTLERGTMNVLLGPTLSGKTIADAADGGAGRADRRAGCAGTGRM